ncbi:Transcriptional adapter 2 [Neolecta irregularis DAH-3]|uniref:Transcriptional adapter 2 n=1 Tax=Neolecta irregularis (strain DAH-3) TaxID=1198029 RepID=A0A1U7LJT9_NEOID|nr:Transcriptional adapter 2 [Neolecta irregularis DAH-3]|eukprot:OLL22791.1 Transcriptional adapter 2 [Neolecta irregularis DAH-3]
MTVIHRKQASSLLEPGVKYSCDVCAADITRCVRVHCASCPEYDICVLCFSKGQATSGHKPNHSYCIVEQHSQPIFELDWGADEELLLIEGCETHGLGNWADVALHVGTRTKEDCEEHYINTFINSATYPDPPMSLTFDIDPQALASRKKARLEEHRLKSQMPRAISQKPIASVPQNHEIAGYMPGRLEFDIEYENDAEMSVKDMAFDEEGETPAEVDLKLVILDIYNSRLLKRADRKRVIFEHGLVENKKNQAVEKKRSKDERDLVNRTKPFARVLGKRDYEAFVEGIMKEHILRKRIAELQEWRRNGLTRLEQGQRYETDKAQRVCVVAAMRLTAADDPAGAGAVAAGGDAEAGAQANVAAECGECGRRAAAERGGAGAVQPAADSAKAVPCDQGDACAGISEAGDAEEAAGAGDDTD